MFGERDTPSVALIGHPNVQHFTPIPLHKRESNVLAWIHMPLVATLNHMETLVVTLKNMDTLMHISLHKREHPVMTIPVN